MPGANRAFVHQSIRTINRRITDQNQALIGWRLESGVLVRAVHYGIMADAATLCGFNMFAAMGPFEPQNTTTDLTAMAIPLMARLDDDPSIVTHYVFGAGPWHGMFRVDRRIDESARWLAVFIRSLTATACFEMTLEIEPE